MTASRNRGMHAGYLAVALAYVAATSLAPFRQPSLLLLAALTVFGLAFWTRVRWQRWMWRVACFAFVAALWSSMVLLFDAASHGSRAVWIMARSTVAFAGVAWMLELFSPMEIVAVLARWRLPSMLVAIMAATLRQMQTLSDEAHRMLRAKAARTTRQSRLSSWSSNASMLGLLFVRAHNRAERTHRAMLARGWAGNAEPLLPFDD